MSAGSAEMIAKLFEAQSPLLAAQVQAASPPPLVCFDGHSDGDDTEFLLWIEQFEERSKVDRGNKVMLTKAAPHQTC